MESNFTKDAESRMIKSIDALHNDLAKIRTDRASPALLECIKVPCYGVDTPLNQVANVIVEDSRTLSVIPYDKSLVQTIDKAIRSSDLGLNPVTAGVNIRVPLPPLTEQRRKELIKHVKAAVETAKVAIRNIRRDANNHSKEALKDKKISQDEEKKFQEQIQKATDKYIAETDKILSQKETELMQI
ncbi:MAG: ribosome recycling factor [Francisellaceae bacterium]|nr:ribosome recycling factor [Francisellaceae bacterium]